MYPSTLKLSLIVLLSLLLLSACATTQDQTLSLPATSLPDGLGSSETSEVEAAALSKDTLVCLYENTEYRGRALCYTGATFTGTFNNSWIGNEWNDRISSIRLQSDVSIELFKDVNFGGQPTMLKADTPDLATLAFNDRVSSFKLTRTPSQPTQPTLPTSNTPDFGPNVKIYEPGTPATTIQADIDNAFNSMLKLRKREKSYKIGVFQAKGRPQDENTLCNHVCRSDAEISSQS
jgi:hypothetical protein